MDSLHRHGNRSALHFQIRNAFRVWKLGLLFWFLLQLIPWVTDVIHCADGGYKWTTRENQDKNAFESIAGNARK